MTKEEKVNKPFKVVFVGDSGTGKTKLVAQLTRKKIDCENTNGINFDTHQIQVNNNTLKFSIWDLAGAQKYRAMIPSACHKASAIILVYDISRYGTFKNIANWLKQIRDSDDSQMVMMLIGNKSDMQGSRMVSTKEAQTFATKNGLLFFETSALNDDNVRPAFRHMAITLNNKDPFQIVLVDIEKAAKEEIYCVEALLEDSPLYVTLSYRWGELQESRADTQLDYIASIKGFDLPDFYNLCNVMCKDPDLEEVKYVWVDAICIDQNHRERRKATIYHMTEIYKRAKYVLAVPDLHLQHLKNTSAYNERILDEIYIYEDYMYHLLHGNLDRLFELDEEFLDTIGVPKTPALRQWLTHCTDFFTTGFTKHRIHDDNYEPFEALYHICETIEAAPHTSVADTTDSDDSTDFDSDDSSALQKERAWKKTLGGENDDDISWFYDSGTDDYFYYDDNFDYITLKKDMLKMEDSVHYCNESHCPLDYFYDCGIPWEKSKCVKTVPIRTNVRQWTAKIMERNTLIRDAMKLFMDVIKDWSTRVWVISEYKIAKENNKLKYWFIQFPRNDKINYDKFWKKVSTHTPSFYKFDFNNPVVTTNAIPLLVNKEDTGALSDPIYFQFHALMIKQLAEQTFLEMILKSKASRVVDRLHAVLPLTEYNVLNDNKDVVDSWKITTITDIKLKLYVWISIEEKLDLLFVSGHYDSVPLYPVSPTFATTNISWDDKSGEVVYPPMRAFDSQYCNFDLNNSNTIKLFTPTDDNVQQLYLKVKPETYYMLAAGEIKNDYFDDDFPEYETIIKRFELNSRDDIDIVFIPPFDMNAVKKKDSGFWYCNGITLIGSMRTNKWELHRYRFDFVQYEIGWEYNSCDNDSVGFDIY